MNTREMFAEILRKDLLDLKETIQKIESNTNLINQLGSYSAEKILETLKNGGKILIAGNGGSAAEAQHFSAELIGRFKTERIALPAIALTTDTSILTAIGNDYGYDKVFDRQVAGLGNSKDCLVVMSTSGNSPNILSAVKIAKEKNIFVIGLLGKDGGELMKVVDIPLIVPSNDTARIQEIHLQLIHSWCDFIDKNYI